MTNDELVRRMKDYFARQKTYCEACLKDLESLPTDVEDQTLGVVVERHRTHVEKREALEREFVSLRAEWDGATRLTGAQREEVRGASQSVDGLRKELVSRNVEWKKWVDERMLGLTNEIAGLRRGRTDIGRYDNARDLDASFIDEKI